MPTLSRAPNKKKPLGDTVLVAVPATGTASGKVGYWARDSGFLYVYTGNGATHQWKKVALIAV